MPPSPAAWRVYLGLLPGDQPEEWPALLVALRQEYQIQLAAVMSPPSFEDLDDPLAASAEAEQAVAALRQIEQVGQAVDLDLQRLFTAADDSFFLSGAGVEREAESLPLDDEEGRAAADEAQLAPHMQQMRNCLVMWALRHPHISYRQGMHELLAAVCFCLWQCGEPDDRNNVEADAYALFEALMEHMAPLYVPTDAPATREEAAKRPESPVESLCRRIQYQILSQADPALCTHLLQLQISPECYALRWVQLLLLNEFHLEDSLFLWEAMLADLDGAAPSEAGGLPLLPYLCVAMLLFLSKQLQGRDQSQCLARLSKFPPLEDLSQLVHRARCLRDPSEMALPEHGPSVSVVPFGEGPLGLILMNNADGLIEVSAFQRLGEEPGPAEQSGAICLGDVVVGVNGVPVGQITSRDLVSWIQMLQRPIHIAFETRPPGASASPMGGGGADDGVEAQQVTLATADGFTPELLPGERLLELVEACVVELRPAADHPWDTDRIRFQGGLFLSSYRLLFHYNDPSLGDWHMPLAMVHRIEGMPRRERKEDARTGAQLACDRNLVVCCKDLQVRTFVVRSVTAEAHVGLIQRLAARTCPAKLDHVFAFAHARGSATPAAPSLEPAASTPPSPPDESGWDVYTPALDYMRLGMAEQWRMVDQRRLALCPTYPQLLVVPATMSDDELRTVCGFRSKRRLPVVVWRHYLTGATISRSAQPLVGLGSNRCVADEKMLAELAAGGGASRMFVVMDARKKSASLGNRAMGKGTELMQFYPGMELRHMNIENIHSLRDSWQSLVPLCQPYALEKDPRGLQKLENTGWLRHVHSVMVAAVEAVNLLERRGVSLLVHCSDGWDRTAQITGLTELLLDPEYRSFRGFQMLVAKEWCSFGHMFGNRCGQPGNDGEDQFSPVFLLWVDCVWQVLRQFPTAFEFNEAFLICMVDHVYSCRFGTFLGNSQDERHKRYLPDRTRSLWSHLNSREAEFRNSDYEPVPREEGALVPRCSFKHIKIFEPYFFRWDYSMQPRPEPARYY